jgi:lipid-binding SYLF domain-containing protein
MCRNKSGVGWGAPAAMRVEGGSFGFQIGGQSTDVVMLVMNDGGMQHLLKSKFTLGGDASVAAGPVGREATAKTDATMGAEILSWSRARGVFAGVSLQGATLRNDDEGNHELYGKDVHSKEILTSDMAPPAEAQPLITALNRHSKVEGHDSADREKPDK